VGLLQRHREEVTERQLELVREAYRSTRAWELQPVKELLASGVPGREAAWDVVRGVFFSRRQRADDLPRDLFRLPPHWEITDFEIHQVTSKHDAIFVVGACRCRPKGSWDVVRLPFLHVWHLRDGRAARVENRFNLVEVRRAA
jgi:ketosteroid isomerase-like protein